MEAGSQGRFDNDMGAESTISSLLAALEDSDAQVRHDAATALGKLGPKQGLVIQGLLNLLLDSDPDTRAAAQEGLYKGVPESVRELASLLREGPLEVRKEVVMVLEWMGEKAAIALPALRDALADEDESVRWWAQRALAKVEASTGTQAGEKRFNP